MDQCPHCGSSITDGPKCPNCGQSLDALPEYQSEPTGHGAASPAQTDGLPGPGEPLEPEQPEAEGTPDGDAAEATEQPDGPIGGRLSRRALLGGAGASVALLGVGGAGWMYLQDGGAGDAVIRSYFDAMTTENWSRAEDLYHDDSPTISRIEESQEIADYEGYLESREVLETWKNIDPEIDGIQEFYHATEVTEESIEDLRIQLDTDAVKMVDEVRSAIAFLAVEVGTLNEEQKSAKEYYKDGTQNRPLTCNLVLVDGDWSLWTVRGLGRFG
ncbi:hypothetical protein [Halovenus sp. HT40]|uniref:hypothetical protein n=1 Tax=Halovenus sp. HT40 TaxID=3126691 RepID=UPI00300EFD34